MLTASEARERNSEKENENYTEELMNIELAIIKAIEHGREYVVVQGCLYEVNKEKLKELGYSIDFASGHGRTLTIISW